MKNDLRKVPRFEDIGKVEAPEICLFPGILINISDDGCRMQFPSVLDIDNNTEYDVKITPARKDFCSAFKLKVTVKWTKIFEGSTEIGFKINCPPATKDFAKYILSLQDEKHHLEEEKKLLENFKN